MVSLLQGRVQDHIVEVYEILLYCFGEFDSTTHIALPILVLPFFLNGGCQNLCSYPS